jgi:hypothetical protein
MVSPIEISWRRDLRSAFDGVPFTPKLGYQFGLGGVGAFREVAGRLATAAGLTSNVTINGALNLPFSVSLSNRYNRMSTRNWARRLGNTQSVTDGQNVSFPDLTVGWTLRPPRALTGVLTSLGLRGGYRRTEQSTFVPGGAGAGAEQAEQSARVTRGYPINLSVAWGFGSGLSTAAGFNASESEDRRPGGTINSSRQRDVTVDVGKSFKPPPTWNLKSDIRTRVSFQRTAQEASVFSVSTAKRSPLANNGRHAFNLNADTDVAENLTFSLQGSRVLSFDNQNNRRFSQTVITAVMQLQFFAGELH